MTTATVAEMEPRHHWFRRLDAEHRSWITLVAQAGIDGFVTWFAAPGAAGAEHLRRLRLGSARAGPADLALPDRRAGADHDRRGRDPDRRGDAQGGPADPARRDRPVQPGGGLLRRRDLRPGGRAARRLGRAARGPGGRRGAARRDRRDRAVPGLDPGLALDRDASWWWSGRRRDLEPALALESIRHTAAIAGTDMLGAVQGDRMVVVLGGPALRHRRAGARGGGQVRPPLRARARWSSGRRSST